MKSAGGAVHEPDLFPLLGGAGAPGERPQVPAAESALQVCPRHCPHRLYPHRSRQALPGLPRYIGYSTHLLDLTRGLKRLKTALI
jgi:hypothetical protein